MSGIDERHKAVEGQLRHDDELRFKVTVKRNKALGKWVAEQLGKSGDEATAYIAEVVAADFEEPGNEDVIRKVKADFDEAGILMGEGDIRTKLITCTEAAIVAVETGK